MRKALIFILLSACASRSPEVPKAALKATAAKPSGYSRIFRELPLAASLTRLPWASDSWSSAHGGASFRWQAALADELEDLEELDPVIQYPIGKSRDIQKLSPTEKLDLYLANKKWDFTVRERRRTLQQTNSDGSPRKGFPEWEGIMHAWSVAALQFEPVGPATVQTKDGKSIRFEAQDIYSLLSLYVHEQSPRAVVLAALCEKQMDKQELAAGVGPYAFENNKQAARRRGCERIDAATFHVVLANQIGKLNEGFIIDRDRQGEISNNPVVAYETRIVELPRDTVTTNQPRTLHLRTILFLTEETPVLQLEDDDGAYPYDTESYEYELDLDRAGKIVAGRWLDSLDKKSATNTAIPDFMWKSSPVWLNGPLKAIYDQGQQSYASQSVHQLRPIEDMPMADRNTLNAYFNNSRTRLPQ